jgi:hypothetical protein
MSTCLACPYMDMQDQLTTTTTLVTTFSRVSGVRHSHALACVWRMPGSAALSRAAVASASYRCLAARSQRPLRCSPTAQSGFPCLIGKSGRSGTLGSVAGVGPSAEVDFCFHQVSSDMHIHCLKLLLDGCFTFHCLVRTNGCDSWWTFNLLLICSLLVILKWMASRTCCWLGFFAWFLQLYSLCYFDMVLRAFGPERGLMR